jgi:hypothetical protein
MHDRLILVLELCEYDTDDKNTIFIDKHAQSDIYTHTNFTNIMED